MHPRASQAPRCLDIAGVISGSHPTFSEALGSTASFNDRSNVEASLYTSRNGERSQEARTLLRVTQGIVTTGEVLEDSHLRLLAPLCALDRENAKERSPLVFGFQPWHRVANCPQVGWEEGYGSIVWKGGVTWKARRIFATIFCLLTPGPLVT